MAAAADIVHEYYLAAILDRAARRILLMASAEGGVEIEEVAATTAEAILRVYAHPHLGLLDYQARQLAFGLGLGGPHLRAAWPSPRGSWPPCWPTTRTSWRSTRWRIVRATGPDGQAVVTLDCLDAKITLDDSGLARHPGLEALRDLDEEDPTDAEARAQGISFIQLDGDIGCMVNGAGLAMTTMDLVKRAAASPANFLDIGGGARSDQVAAAMRPHPGRSERARHPGQHLRRHHPRRRGRPRPRSRPGPSSTARCPWSCASSARTPPRPRTILRGGRLRDRGQP